MREATHETDNTDQTVATSTRHLVVGALVLGIILGGAVQAAAEPLKCRRAIAKASAKYTEAKAKLLHKCEEKVLRGRIAGPCPDAKTLNRLARAESKLAKTIARRCGGDDKVCGAGGDEDLGSIMWDIGTCPDLMGGGCTDPIVDCSDVTECVECAVDHATDALRGLFYDDLEHGDTDKILTRCQREIGKSATRLAHQKARLQSTCEDKLLRGRIAGPCPNGSTAHRIAKKEARMATKICRACGGPNRACGDGDDLDVALIGAGATCPDVTVPDGPACGGAITDVRSLLRCVDCLTRYATDCLDRLAVPGLAEYPDECRYGPDGAPTPTPTSATPTATSATPTATPTLNPSFCNNGVLDFGETCDFPDVGCSSGEVCAACAACLPPPGTCLNDVLDGGEACEIPDVGCADGELCASCVGCVEIPPVCGDGIVDLGETCDGNASCDAGEVCLGCVGCYPEPGTCLNSVLDAGEHCETLTNEGCAASEVCLGCLGCFDLPVSCGNSLLEPLETCELDNTGCGEGDLCLGCLTCVPNITTCGNGELEPGEACELINQGCGLLQICLLCETCVGL